MFRSTSFLQLLLLVSVCSVYTAPTTGTQDGSLSSNQPRAQKKPSSVTSPKDVSSSSSGTQQKQPQKKPKATDNDIDAATGGPSTDETRWDFPYMLLTPSTNRSPQGGDIQDRVTWAPDKNQFVMYVKIGDASWEEKTGEVTDSDNENDSDNGSDDGTDSGSDNDPPKGNPGDNDNPPDDPKGKSDDPKDDPKKQSIPIRPKKDTNNQSVTDKPKGTKRSTFTEMKQQPQKRDPSISTREADYVTHNPAFIYTASMKTKLPHTTKISDRPGRKLQNEVFGGYKPEGASRTNIQIFQVPSLKKTSEWYELLLGEDAEEAVKCSEYVRENMWESFTNTNFGDSKDWKDWVANAKKTLQAAISGKCSTSGSSSPDKPVDKPTKD
ncbi:hypothetical protein K435DRAFT_860990 [Dendrothele bispora CBS 962.96]|uniref:Uncharacterized protein n=1 Tax=Dendrothele bispora (strain CBS 962.96) TaxID=1314807 RepID=A0A4S8LXT7_DENBC|nr:hypothetical protein K435DRAFT_860990 [Dendrothele bispora CBS 962.96]